MQFKVNLVKAPYTGDITGVLTVTDITEKTMSNRILHQLSATNYDFVADLDLKHDVYRVANRKKNTDLALEDMGIHSRRVTYMCQNAIVPKDKARYAEALETKEIYRRLEDKKAYTFSFSMYDDKGDLRTKNMTVFSLDMRLGRVCLARTDITDSIREQQGLLHMIAYTFERAGFLNVNTRRLTVYTRQDLLENLLPNTTESYSGRPGDFTGQGSKTAEEGQFSLDTMLPRLNEQPEGYDFVYSFQSESGLRYKQVNILWGDGEHQVICLVQADVTDILMKERRRKEELEKALAMAEEANRAKTVFLSHMSHDIRTPINGIMGMADIASRNMESSGRIEDCLNKIMSSSNHLLSLVNDVLDMSRIESGKVELGHNTLNIAALLDGCYSVVAGQAIEKSIRFIKDFSGVTQELVQGDELHLRQIFINILGNAVKFTPEQGEIRFTAWDGECNGQTELVVTVRDTGIGMSHELQDKIFEPFVQLKNLNRSIYQGTGLGMAIVKQLLGLMGGDIEVESELGRGSTFTVRLRLPVGERQGGTTRLPSGNHDFSGMRVMLVEDNELNMEIAQYVLEDCGVEVTTEVNGREALERYLSDEDGSYDLILMDVMMPVMGGLEAARAIRASHKADARIIPIVAMTANAYEEDRHAAFEAGMNRHLSKPMVREDLIAVLSEFAGPRREIHETQEEAASEKKV